MDRFQESYSMVQETQKYYDHITSSIAKADLASWSSSIKAAEEKRLDDPSVMDILGARRCDLSDHDNQTDNHLTSVADDWCRLALSVEERQIDIQNRVRRLGKEPREDDRQEIERLREILNAELSQVFTLHCKAVEGISRPANPSPQENDCEIFDNLDDESLSSSEMLGAATMERSAVSDMPTAVPSMMAPERQTIPMPSNCLQDHRLRALELSLRKQQAERYLNALREVIADKSFQYSHVMRDAPKKSVRTRARAVIGKLNDRISLYSQIYTKCRAALVRLDVDQRVLDEFQILQKDDVRASTAILDPNRPGASTLRLSWIWQTSITGLNQSPDSVRECM